VPHAPAPPERPIIDSLKSKAMDLVASRRPEEVATTWQPRPQRALGPTASLPNLERAPRSLQRDSVDASGANVPTRNNLGLGIYEYGRAQAINVEALRPEGVACRSYATGARPPQQPQVSGRKKRMSALDNVYGAPLKRQSAPRGPAALPKVNSLPELRSGRPPHPGRTEAHHVMRDSPQRLVYGR